MSAAPIYVVVVSDDLFGRFLERELEQDPQRKPNPIVMETDVEGATLEKARKRAAELELRYGPCRVGRVIFENEPNFEAKQ